MGKHGPKPLTWEQFIAGVWQRIDVVMDPPGACWPFTGRPDARGYGQVQARGLFATPVLVHDVVLYSITGMWPTEGMHHCDNPPCARPSHLADGTHHANIADMIAKGRLRIGGRTSATWPKKGTPTPCR